MYKDLREFIAAVDKLRALRRIEGADPRFEIGGITEVAAGLPDCPALLFDNIKGFPRGFRVFTNATTNVQRAALALGLDPALRPLDALKAWMEKRKNLTPQPPVTVKTAAFLDNTVAGRDVDIARFPAPIWHRHDGGPFIGSGSLVIMRDPDSGWIKGAPIEVFDGPQTGLPLPALAEIILEGRLLSMSEATLPEGPFGEFTGYYAAAARPGPVMEVSAIHHRNDPILLGSPPMKPPRFHFGLPFRAATIWSNLEAAGVTDVVGAWQHVSQLMTVVALRRRYDGHAKRAALVAAAHSYMARIVVVVDDDIDPSNLADVMWAVATRCEPAEGIDIVRNAWSSALDPRISPEDKKRGVTSHSKAIIDACRPFAWREKFPPTSALSSDEAREIETKWGKFLGPG